MHYPKVSKVLFEKIKCYLPKQIITTSPLEITALSDLLASSHMFPSVNCCCQSNLVGKKKKATKSKHLPPTWKHSDSPRPLWPNERRVTVTYSFANGYEDAGTTSDKKEGAMGVRAPAVASYTTATQLQPEIFCEHCWSGTSASPVYLEGKSIAFSWSTWSVILNTWSGAWAWIRGTEGEFIQISLRPPCTTNIMPLRSWKHMPFLSSLSSK